jgi:CBS domain-containing protein
LLCVAFFVIHGAELRLDQFWQLGAVGTAYIVLRILGKYFGIRIAARWTGKSKPVRHWLGATMLSQAGAAIALAAHAVARDRVTFEPVQTVILGSVIVFEIMGPLMIRLAVIRSGEVPIAYVARHSTMSFADGWRAMWWKLRTSLGADPQPAVEAQEMTIASLMRSRVLGIKQDARFDEIISHIEHSHDNTFPVINATNQLVGIIRYPTLSESLFDPSVSNLVRAEDLATSVARFVYPDQPVSAAFDFFMSSRDDCIPVVSREEANQLVGIVRRADVRTLLIRKRRKGSGH